jgi:nucleoside-diphosphate kinase
MAEAEAGAGESSEYREAPRAKGVTIRIHCTPPLHPAQSPVQAAPRDTLVKAHSAQPTRPKARSANATLWRFMSQRTFSIIKPDAVKKGDTAAILAEISKAGFKLVAIKKIVLTKPQAEGFYHVHSARPFFGELTEFMSSGVIYPMVLEKDNAIADLRTLMGATDPAKADAGTIRKMFASSIGENAIHGSDAEDTAAFEIGYFFAGYELK